MLIQQKKIISWSQQGLNPQFQGDRPASPKPLNMHKGLLMPIRESFLYLFDWKVTVDAVNNESHRILCRCPKETFANHANVLYEPGTTKFLFFFSSGQRISLSLYVNERERELEIEEEKKIDRENRERERERETEREREEREEREREKELTEERKGKNKIRKD